LWPIREAVITLFEVRLVERNSTPHFLARAGGAGEAGSHKVVDRQRRKTASAIIVRNAHDALHVELAVIWHQLHHTTGQTP
jgi:hypothetical protein